MRYYITADVHGFYSNMKLALQNSGYYEDPEPHKLVILGDLFDRGKEAMEMQKFILQHLEEDAVILVRGNHEDLFEDFATTDEGRALSHHRSNGTYDTALQLTGIDPETARRRRIQFASKARSIPYYREILPQMVNYYETANHVFVHGWIPCVKEGDHYSYISDWRNASDEMWRRARWINGMDAAQSGCIEERKTILCGHWHASYGHCRYENRGSEFGHDAIFDPYYGQGIIALDACTAYSGRVNVIILEDEA